MSSTAFTEVDRRRLEALKEKERKAKQAERNEQKRADTMCKKLFGMSAKEVQEKLSDNSYWYDRWNEQQELIKRLMAVAGKQPEDFQQYVEWREQKQAEKTN